MHIGDKELENFIIESGLVSKKEMDKATVSAKEKKLSLGSVLISSGVLNKDDLRRAEAHVLGIPFVNLKDTKIDLSTLSFVPEPIARKHNIVAFKTSSDALEVAMLDIKDLGRLDFLKKKTKLKVVPHLTDDESMKWALSSYQKALKSEFGDVIVKDKSVAHVLEALLKHAILQGASDIHIEPMEDRLLVRYRIAGLLHDAMVLPKGVFTSLSMRLKKLANLKPEEKVPQDGRFQLESDGETLSFRLMTQPIPHGEKLFIRIVPRYANGFTLEGLGLQGESLEELHNALNLREGLIIVSGLARSGKTTTLYTLLDILNSPSLNISTIEDPVEYYMHRINQTQVRPELGFGFAHGLRALMNRDTDVIMVGDLNDAETAQLAVSAAYAGRLVLAAMSASSPKEAILSLNKMSVSPHLLSSSLKLALSQRLVPGPDGSLRGEYDHLKMTPTLREFILKSVI